MDRIELRLTVEEAFKLSQISRVSNMSSGEVVTNIVREFIHKNSGLIEISAGAADAKSQDKV